MTVSLAGRDVVAIDDFSREELEFVITKAGELKEREKEGRRNSHELKGKRLYCAFYEPSTRTRLSTEEAMSELGGSTFGFSDPRGTSVSKGETTLMTSMMEAAYHADVLIMRHPKDGSVQWIADILDIPVINGGDGKNEHPTQALLDLFTINELHPGVDGVNIGFGGDLKHGRTVRSNIVALSKFDNVTVHWAAHPAFALPQDLIALARSRNVTVREHENVKDVFRACTVYYMTRPQKERVLGEYDIQEIITMMADFRITMDKIKAANPAIKILHPLPIDQNIGEIENRVAFSENQYFFAQAENGIFVRKAILLGLLEGMEYKGFNPTLSEGLLKDNARIQLPFSRVRDASREDWIGPIEYGTAIDHLKPSERRNLCDELEVDQYILDGAVSVPSTRYGKKSVIKIPTKISPDDVKRVLLRSPNATFNLIEGGELVAKAKAIICSQDNCITRVVSEGVPSKFYVDDDGVRCHYCRKQVGIGIDFGEVLSGKDLERYAASLPNSPQG